MARLNIKSTRNEFLKKLKELETKAGQAGNEDQRTGFAYAQFAIIELAKELEIEIKPEEYK